MKTENVIHKLLVLLMLSFLFVANTMLAQTLPTDVISYETVTVSIPATSYDENAGGSGLGVPQMAKVKFNRQFPLVITSDDGRKPEYISNWALMNGYPNVRDWQDYPYLSGNDMLAVAYDKTYMGTRSSDVNDYQPLTFDDGTGKPRRFTLTSAVPPTGSSKTPSTASYDQINREDARAMLRTGFSFAQHDVDDASSVETIKSDYTRLNTLWAENVGIGLKVMVEPNGNKNYVTAAEQSDEICWNIYQGATQDHPALDNTLAQWTDDTTPSTYANTQATTRTFPNSDAAGETAFANSVRTAISNGNTDPMFYGCHGLGSYAQNLLKDLATNATYKDKVWVTGADEFWEYYHIYNNIVIENVSYADGNLTFDVKVPTYKKNQFRELTINIPGLTGTGAPTFSGADGSKVITGSYSTDGGTGIGYTLNIGLESSITTHIDQLLTVYRDDQTNLFVKRDAQYLIDQLWDGTAKTNYQNQLDAAAKYNYTIGSTLDGATGPTIATILTDTNGEKTFSVPRYIVDGGKLYETSKQAAQPYYKHTVNTGNGTPASISYTEKSLSSMAGNITPVAVSVVEGEDMAGARVVGASFNNAEAIKIGSNGLGGNVVDGTPITAVSSLSRGKYKMIIGYGENYKSQGNYNYQILVDGTQVATFATTNATNNAVTEFTTEEFTVEVANTPITITTDNTNNNSRWIDYVVFVQTSSLDPVAPSITATASADTAASVKVGTSITITATAAQNGGSNFTGTTIYQCSDAAGTIDGEAKATSATESATYTFTPDAAGTYYFKAVASDGTLGSNTTEVITVNVVADIDEYTLVIIDKSGGEAMTTTVQSSALTTDPLPGKLRSPYAENYKYYTTKAEAQANSGSYITALADFSQATIYVGYDVKSDGLKFDGSKPYAIYANSRYLHGVFREDQAHVTNNMWGLQRQSYDSWNSSNTNVTTTTFPFLDGSYLWYLQGGDPYNIRLQNKAARRYTSHENNANAGYRAGFTTDAASSARYCLVYWNGSTSTADYCALWNRDYSMYVYMNSGSDYGSWRLDPSASKGEGKIYIADLPHLNINVLNPETHEVEYIVDGRFMSGATLPSAIPFYLQRAFTSGQAFYYTKADAIAGTNAISGTPDASSMNSDGNLNVYLTYTLDANSWGTSGTIKPSVDENDAYWMSMEFPDGNRKLEAANSGTYEVNPSQTTVTTKTPKLQWAFIGTPYSFRLINRANSGRVMGVDKSITTATNAVMYENPSTSIACDWEMVNYQNGGSSTNPLIRLRGSISGEAPLLFVLSQANQKTLSTTEANNNRISSFTLIEEVHPAIPPTVTLTTTTAQTIETKTVVTLKATPVWNGTTDLTNLQFQYKVTGGADGDWENIGEAITSITSGTEYTKEFSPASSGTYSFRAVVTDADGTTGASASDDATPASDDAGLVTLSVVDDLQSDAAYSYKMKATLMDGTTEVDTQWLHNMESATALTNQHYFFPRYILNGTTLYEVTANTPTKNGNNIQNTMYGIYRDVDGQNQRDNLTYNKVAGKDNVVFFGEAEDISGSSNIRCPNSSNTNQFNWNSAEGRFTWFSSMGYGLRTNGSYGTVTTLPAGKYTITIGLVGSSGANAVDDTNSQIVTVGGNEVGQFKYTATGDGNLIECTTSEFSIYSEQSVVISHSESKNNGLDYVYIQRTGDANVTAPTVTLSVDDASSKAIETGGEALISTAVTLKATATMNGGESLKNLTFQQKTGSGEWTTISTVATPTSGTEYTATYTPLATGTVYFRALATTDVDGTSELTGCSQSNTEDDATAFAVSVVEHLTINEYTLHVIDNEGHDVFGDAITITKAEKDGLASGQDPLVTLRPQYASPFVSSYLYFNTAAEAQTNSGTATTWDQADIYVGYTVDATKMGADKVHAIWANNRYMHSVLDTKKTGNGGPEYKDHNIYKIDNQKWDVAAMSDNYTDFTRNEISTSNLPFIDNTYMWKLGTDPYNVVIENKANGGVLNTNYNANPTYYAKSQESNANHYAILYYQGKNANSTVEITTDYCLMFDRTKSTSTTLAYNDIGSRYLGCSGDNDNQWRTMDKNHGAYAKLYITQLPSVNINILNGDGDVEATLQGYLNSSASMSNFTPYFLWRAYTSGHTFYYDQAHTSQITGTPNASTIAGNGNNVYVTYTLDTSKWLSGDADTAADTYFIKPNDANNYYWYMLRPMGQDDKALRADEGGLPAIVNRAHEDRTNITSDPTTDKSKRSQWSFEGTPYNVKLINRYYGSNVCLGIAGDCAAGGRFSMYDQNASGVITAWEVMSSLANSSKLFFRPQGSYGGEAPHLYLGWDGGATQTGMTIAAGSNQACDFTYIATTEKEHPSTVHLTASTTTPHVDEPVTLTATATPDNKEVNNVTYLVIEQETSTGVWKAVGTAYNEADATTASMKDGTTKVVTATYTFTPTGAGDYNFRARAVIDGATQYSTDEASAGGDGSPVTVTASVVPLTVGSDDYTLILVDKQGKELFTESNVSKTRVEETNSVSGRNGDPIDNSWRSPLVTKYRYYSTKTDARGNTGVNLFDWSSTAATPTVYVGYEVGNEVDLIEVDPTARQARSATDNTQVRNADAYTTMYMIKFKNGQQFYQESSDKLGDQDQAIYPYTCGDGAMYIYGENKRQSDSQSASTTRERWPWFIVSQTGDPYHVVVTSWKETHANEGTNYYNYLHTYYNSSTGTVVTNTISDDPRVKDTSLTGGSTDNVPTVYMMLGTSHNYKLVTVDPISNGTTNERRTVSTMEQYWKTYETISKNGTLSTTELKNTDFTSKGISLNRYQNWAYGRPINATDATKKENKTYAYDYHWYQTISMGETFDLEPIDLNGVLVLLDNHGWEIMRKPIATPGSEHEAEMKAAIRKYDSPMVKAYHFWETGTKVSGYHKYTVKTLHSDGTSLADYPIIRNKYKNIGDIYVTYDVKDEYAMSYTGAATAAGTSASKFVISQGGTYAKADGSRITGVADAASADKWYLKPNFDIDKEMGYKYDLDVDGKTGGTSLTEAETNTAYHENGQSGFDPYNLQIQNVSDQTKFFTTNAVRGDLDGIGGMTSTYSEDMVVTLTAGTRPTTTNGEGQDNVDLFITNATFMAVQDGNGNMRLMPRFDHAHVIDGFSTLSTQDAAQPADDTANPQSTQLTTGTITYHIIDNSGADVFGALTYSGAGFAVAKEYQSPMVEEYYFHSTQAHATDSETRMTSDKTSFDGDDEVWVSYKAKDEFASATWNIWNTNGMYMHAVSRNDQTNGDNIWWMSNQNQDRGSNATTTTLSTTTMPFLDNSFGWQFVGVGDTPDPYNVTLLNKAAKRYVKQNDTSTNNGRMDHMQTNMANATPYSILYYTADADNGNAILYDRTHNDNHYVRENGNEWRINSTNRETTGELVITQLPALNISVVNADGEIDVTLHGFYKSGCTWTSFVPLYLERLHTSGQAFYYDRELQDPVVSGQPVDDSKVEAKDTIFVKYTLDSNWGTLTKTGATNDVMPSPTDNKIQWYAIKASSQDKYFQAPAAADGALNTSTTQPGDTDSETDKRGQWALMGTPYNLKLVNRYLGMGDYLGVPTEDDGKAYVYGSEEGHVTTWEVVTGMGGQTGGLQIRPQRSFNGETTYGYVGFGGSATGVYANPNGNLNNVLIWLKETPAKSITFKLYDANGNYMANAERGAIADNTLTGYQQGDELATVFAHTNLQRRFCEYSFYKTYDSTTKTFADPITKAQETTDEDVYVKWEYVDHAPVFMPWGDASTFTPASTNPDDYQYYLMDVTTGNYYYLWGVTGNAETGYTLKIDGNVESAKARVHQFAFIGDPYTMKIYSRNAAKCISTITTGTSLVIDNTPEGGDEVEVVFDMPNYSTESLVNMRFRRKGTGMHIVGSSNNIWLSTSAFECRTRDMVVPVRIFKEGATIWPDDLKDYREYTVDLLTATTESRITDTNLRATANAVGTARDFRHAFCDYTFYRTYDWIDEAYNAIPAEGLPYFGGKDQYKRQFFGTYVVDEETFGRIWFMDMKPTDNNPGWWMFKNNESTNGYTTGFTSNSGKTTVVDESTGIYRWQFSGDPYNLQIHSLSMGDFKENYVLAAKALSESSSTAPTETAGTLVLLTDDTKEGGSDTESYGQYSHWEIIQRSSGNYVLWNIDTDERYSYCLTNQSGTGNLFVIPAPSASQMPAVTWQLEDAIGHHGVTWHVMENTATENMYTVVASITKVVENNAVLTLEDMPESLKRHFCDYTKMYSTLTGTTTEGTLSGDCTENGFTVTSPADIYVTYELNSGAPEFIKEAPTGTPTGTESYWYEIHFPNAGSYLYTDGTSISKDNSHDINAIRTGITYPYYRWALIGSPYDVKFYNMETKNFMTNDGTALSMGSTGTSFDLLDNTFDDEDIEGLGTIYDTATSTYITGNAGLLANQSGFTACEFSNVNGVVHIVFRLHYSDKTLRKYDSNNDGDLSDEPEGNAVNTLDNIDITTFQKLGKDLNEIFPQSWKRTFCNYTYYWKDGTGENSTISEIETTQTEVTQEMINAYNNDHQPIYIHVSYDFEGGQNPKWSKQGETPEYYWYYLVNNHRPSGEQGKMVFRDSSPKLRVSTALVDDRLYLNNFEWCVIGDPYGFKMLNHYDPDHRFDEFISVTDTKDAYSSAGYQLEQVANNSNCLFEMMPGQHSYNFWMHPIYTKDLMDEMTYDMSYIGNNANGSAAIIPNDQQTMAYLKTNSSANFRLEILSDATLTEYVKYAGFVGSLKYDVANGNKVTVDGETDPVNVAAIKTKLLTGKASEEEKILLHNIINNPDNIEQMVQGYYRIVPYALEGEADHYYVQGYLNDSQRTSNAGGASSMLIETQNGAEYDPSTIFWFESTKEAETNYPRYYVHTQGLSMAGNGLVTTNAETDYKVRYEDLGAAITQLKVSNTASREYLSCASTSGTSTNQCFDEQAGVYKTRFYLQKVGEANNSEMDFKAKLMDMKDGYFYVSLYVPFDVDIDKGVAFIGKQEYANSKSGQDIEGTGWKEAPYKLRCYSVNDQTGKTQRYIPAGTPVLIRVATDEANVENNNSTYTNARYVKANVSTIQGENGEIINAPSAAVSSEFNKFRGQYLAQVLPLQNNEVVYVHGLSSKYGPGFFKNGNTYEGVKNNAYVKNNKLYYTSIVSSGAKSFGMAMFVDGIEDFSGSTTGIQSNSSDQDIDWENAEVYDLQGRRVRDPQRGIYIVNGKKVVIK